MLFAKASSANHAFVIHPVKKMIFASFKQVVVEHREFTLIAKSSSSVTEVVHERTKNLEDIFHDVTEKERQRSTACG